MLVDIYDLSFHNTKRMQNPTITEIRNVFSTTSLLFMSLLLLDKYV